MASSVDCYVFGMEASDNGSRARKACTHGCDQGMCGDTTPHVNFLAGETHDVYSRQIRCPCRDIADGVCKCSSNGFIYPELPACFGEVFGEEGPTPSDKEFDDAVADGIRCLSDEYRRLTDGEPSPTMAAAISHVVSGYVNEYAPTHVQHVFHINTRQLMRKVIQTWFHIKQEGRFMLGGRYDVSWKDGNLRLEKISYKLRHEYTLCNNAALDLLMDILCDYRDFLAPQLNSLLN